jgi:tryptophanyl-tRNA synthetase
MKIKTNSLEPGQPKDINDSILYDIYKAFATPEETKNIQLLYQGGIAWGEMKNILFECINDQLRPAREEYKRLINDPGEIENQLIKGAKKAREISVPYIQKIRNAVGIRKLI